MRTKEEIDAEIAKLERLVMANSDMRVIKVLLIEFLSDAPTGIMCYAKRWKDGSEDKPFSQTFVEMGLAVAPPR